MLRLKSGKLPFLVLALLLSGCRKDPPPKITICIGDGVGGADCVLADGSREYWPPSRLKNTWITTQPDMANFSSWCYKTSVSVVEPQMREIEALARGGLPVDQWTPTN